MAAPALAADLAVKAARRFHVDECCGEARMAAPAQHASASKKHDERLLSKHNVTRVVRNIRT
jgi:hypothetical protein